MPIDYTRNMELEINDKSLLTSSSPLTQRNSAKVYHRLSGDGKIRNSHFVSLIIYSLVSCFWAWHLHISAHNNSYNFVFGL